MLSELRASSLLGAFRGRSARDVGGFAAPIDRTSQLPFRASNLLERDLNPVSARDTGGIIGDVHAVVAGDASGDNAASVNHPDRVGENEGTA